MVDHIDGIIGPRACVAPGGSGGRAAPVTSTVPFGSRLAICAIASGSRVRKNGNADSGQIRMLGFARRLSNSAVRSRGPTARDSCS